MEIWAARFGISLRAVRLRGRFGGVRSSASKYIIRRETCALFSVRLVSTIVTCFDHMLLQYVLRVSQAGRRCRGPQVRGGVWQAHQRSTEALSPLSAVLSEIHRGLIHPTCTYIHALACEGKGNGRKENDRKYSKRAEGEAFTETYGN